jgi:catechol 2,3-dioxygenase-like lactoylglutathione lyase family enzyme
MGVELDHLILAVNDRQESVRFYSEILGLVYDGERDPFSVMRVTPGLTLQLAPWGTSGGEHLAFAMSPVEFQEAFDRVKQAGIPFGDSFHDVGNMRGPGDEVGSRGPGKSIYMFDPNRHLIELRHYDDSDSQ